MWNSKSPFYVQPRLDWNLINWGLKFMQNILMQVESAWYSLIQARESIRVQEEAVRLATQLHADNQRKVQIGAMAILDEKQAESQAAAARADLSAARRTYAEAQNKLKALVFADHRQQRAAETSMERRPRR